MTAENPTIGDAQSEVPRRRSRPPTRNEQREEQASDTQALSSVDAGEQEIAASPSDSRSRAAKRAAELREHGTLGQNSDDFYIDPAIIPDGWSYEYKRHTVLGAEDPSYQVQLAQGGWEPVPADRHPELMPTGWRGKTILRKGMILMERPLEITELSKKREERDALDQVRQKETQLHGAPPGTFERDNKGNSLVKVRRSYEAMPVPEK